MLFAQLFRRTASSGVSTLLFVDFATSAPDDTKPANFLDPTKSISRQVCK